MDLTTPALLFPAISLLLLAYSNRFVVLANVIRQLSSMEGQSHELVERQLVNLERRLRIIKGMQSLGVLAFLFCTGAMLCLFIGYPQAGKVVFGISLASLLLSLFLSLWEVFISTAAITIELEAFKQRARNT